MLLALLTWNCQNEDIHPVHEGQASKEIYATADQGEVLDLLLDNSGKAGKNGQSPYVHYDMDGLILEEITETEAKLMVIPARTKHKGQQSRILALRVRDTLRTVVFNMYPSMESGQDGPFNGEITLATIQGKLLGGYKVEGLPCTMPWRVRPMGRPYSPRQATMSAGCGADTTGATRPVSATPSTWKGSP